MIKITVRDLIDKCNGRLFCGNDDTIIGECFVDSRLNVKDGTFFGIKGNNVDGTKFYRQAFDNGASVCIVSNMSDFDFKYKNKTIVIVQDVLEALRSIAVYKRSLFEGEVIGITGSVGKTSTKEMIVSVLEKKYKVLKTIGNQNSQVGLPLTILRLNDEEVMVLEMGMSEKGEMHNLSVIAKPTISVITNVLTAHIGNLGSRQNILEAKLEILDGMEEKKLVINLDNDMLSNAYQILKDSVMIHTYGIDKGDVRASNIKENVRTSFDVNEMYDLEVFGGRVFIYNALAAIMIGNMMNVSSEEIKEGLVLSTNAPHRLEVISIYGLILIDDTYNASYDSVKAALEFMNLFSGKKVVVLADMLELGEESLKIHKSLGEEIVKNKTDFLVTIGKHTKETKKASRKLGMKRKCQRHFKDEKKARKYVCKLTKKYDVMLVKGSNSFKLVNLISYLKGE